jgi:hypothetical protein
LESHLVCYISSGLLALLLAVQQYQHNRTNRRLIDKILESRGLTSLPDEHPLVETVKSLAKSTNEPLTEKRKQEILQRVRFKIPGMPEYMEKK